jgi:tRNA-specific 2-thiouridylase
VGQGKRLGDAAVLDGERQVVVATDPGRRRVVVGPRGTGTQALTLRDVNWLVPVPTDPSWPGVSGPPVAARSDQGGPDQPGHDDGWMSNGIRCSVKLRAREEPRPAIVRTEAGATTVTLDDPALPAPGQACVFYRGDQVLGGGIITRSGA